MATNPKGQTKRDEILETASLLFYKQGYQATGIQQIIETAETAKGTFYSHFRSKDALGAAWLTKRAAEWSHAFKTATQEESDPRQRILACFDYLASDLEASDFRGCAFINTIAETPDSESSLQLHIREAKLSLRSYFNELCEACSPGESEDLALTVYMLFEASIIEGQIFRSLEPLKTARAHVQKLIHA